MYPCPSIHPTRAKVRCTALACRAFPIERWLLRISPLPGAALSVNVTEQILNHPTPMSEPRRRRVQYCWSVLHNTWTAPGTWWFSSPTPPRETRPRILYVVCCRKLVCRYPALMCKDTCTPDPQKKNLKSQLWRDVTVEYCTLCYLLRKIGLQGEVGGWGRDPKKCTGRDWGMGSSTI